MDKAGHAEAVFWFVVLDGMAAHQNGAGLLYLVRASGKDFPQHGRVEAVGEAHDVQGDFRLAAHGIHIAQCVGRRDLAEGVGVVHYGGEKVDGLYQCDLVGDFIDCRIIGGLDAYQQPFVIKAGQLTQNLGKGLRTNLRRSSRGF